MNEKKCLVISVNCISETACNGKTVKNILSSFDEQNVAVFYTYNELPDFQNRYNLYRITDHNMMDFKLLRKKECGEHITSSIESASVPQNRKRSLDSFKRLCRDIMWGGLKWCTGGLDAFVDEFNPDFVLFLGLNNPYLYRYCINLQIKKNIPVLIYLTDDYLIPRFCLSPSYWIRLANLRHCFKKLTNNKKTQLITINEVMRKYYREKFNVDSVILTNYIEGTYQEYHLCSEPRKKRIVYVGNLLHNRWKSIIELAKLLSGNSEYVIDVYPGTSINDDIYRAFSSHTNIVVGDNLNAEEVKKVHSEADYLLHVESFEYQDCCLAKLSLSTKITEYAAACKPIIAFCPDSVASYRVLKENNLAICLSRGSDKSFLEALSDEAILQRNVKNAFYYFDNQIREYDMENLILNVVRRIENIEEVTK